LAILDRRTALFVLAAVAAAALFRPADALAQAGERSRGPAQSTQDPADAVPSLGSLWSFSFQVRETWLDNANFVLVNKDDVFLDRAGVGLGYTRNGAKSTFELGTSASGVLRRGREDRTDRTSIDYAGTITWSYQVSPRFSIDLSETYSSRRTQGGELEIDQSLQADPGRLLANAAPTPATTTGPAIPGGVPPDPSLVFPLTEIRNNDTVFNLGYQPFANTTIYAGVQYNRMDFEGNALLDGSQLSARSGVSQALGPLGSIGTSYTYSRMGADQTTTDTQTISADWSRRFGGRAGVTLTGSLGGTKADFVGQTDSKFYLTWNLGLNLSLPQSRKWIPRFNFSRNITPSYGLGRDRVANVVSAGYTVRVARRVRLFANGSYSWSEDPSNPALNYSSQNYGGGLYFGGQHLGMNTSYSLRRTDIGLPGVVDSNSVSMALTYGWQWR
jgi:hypothetical protein